jgi:glycosyltransferase involved in cell wall biosynthesis
MSSSNELFISVIIPHLNQPEGLSRCLSALEQQTYPRDRFEIIVVDNGSTLAPHSVVGHFEGVRLDQELTPGPGPARNRGVALAKGDVLAFVDADCRVDAGWLSAINRAFNALSAKSILGGDVRIDYLDSTRPTNLEAYESVFAYRQKEYIQKQGFSGTGNLAVRKCDFETIGTFAGIEAAEDRTWGRAAVKAGHRIVYIPDMIVFHRARESFGELVQKWDRHILHDYEDWIRHGRSRAVWLLRSGAVAGSAVADIRKIWRSERIQGVKTRFSAVSVLVRIRIYRAIKMVGLGLGSREAGSTLSWNRSAHSSLSKLRNR